MNLLTLDNPLPLAFHLGIMQRLRRGHSCSLQIEIALRSRSVSSSLQLSQQTSCSLTCNTSLHSLRMCAFDAPLQQHHRTTTHL